MRMIIYLRILSGIQRVINLPLTFQLFDFLFWDAVDKTILKDEVILIFEVSSLVLSDRNPGVAHQPSCCWT
jgi:hypothetical protein